MPSTKQIESRMLDLPDPFKPVIALKCGSKLSGVGGGGEREQKREKTRREEQADFFLKRQAQVISNII
jgi:hypothetical protein